MVGENKAYYRLGKKYNKSNLNIMTLKPGYIKSSMSENIYAPKFLFSSTEEVAELIYKLLLKKKLVAYTGIWRYIISLIKLIPEFIFRKINF